MLLLLAAQALAVPAPLVAHGDDVAVGLRVGDKFAPQTYITDGGAVQVPDPEGYVVLLAQRSPDW